MKVDGDYYRDGYAHLQGILPTRIAAELLSMVRKDLEHAAAPKDLVRKLPTLTRPALEFYGPEYKPILGFLWGMTPMMSSLTGKDLLPTFCYFRVYRQGDLLNVHSDRPACEHSLSMTLAYSDGIPWALEFASKRVEAQGSIDPNFGDGKPDAAISMKAGDAVLYQGFNYRHGRTTPNPNRWSAHVFMHWIDSEGPFKAQAFDSEPAAAVPDFGYST